MMFSIVDYPINWQYQGCSALTPIWVIQQPLAGMANVYEEKSDNINRNGENWNVFL